ncbi:MFS transporter [Mangrovimonas sp. AS39]|uniref:MFS transporter n=1 Tax=Mangrovimonas futianensis TaxID=2895523 RepID=UPI001E43CC5F|nr:MFS transporter [Mangrovimonas futianensis]MCF1192787.1 MFS transporter [Mangrovimonas futianensis]MCF1196295.1 MFS transporter [Mangrovimonas futianensis]MCF1422844.1 MFS transporter [Mangrovimonas futianensis]
MLNKSLKAGHQLIATILAFAIVPISGLATDIYIPSMPSMAESLNLPESSIQLTISIFLVSYGVTQFFAGALIDAFGRYRLSTWSLLLFAITFYITAKTENIYVIYAMRVCHGILSGAVVVAKRAFFVDVYEGKERRHYLSIMTIVWSLGPIIAPFLGGYLQEHFGWQANFTALAIFCVVLFVLEVFFSGETLKEFRPFKPNFLVSEFKSMLRTPDFSTAILMCGLSYGIVIFYSLTGPFIIEHSLGYSPIVTGYASLVMGLAWMCGGFAGRFLIEKPFMPKLSFANSMQLFVIVGMLVSSYWLSNLATLVAFAFLVHLAAGFLFNNYFTYSLSRFPNAAGIASGLVGGVTFIITSAISYALVAILQPSIQLGIASGYLVIGLICFSILFVARKRKFFG